MFYHEKKRKNKPFCSHCLAPTLDFYKIMNQIISMNDLFYKKLIGKNSIQIMLYPWNIYLSYIKNIHLNVHKIISNRERKHIVEKYSGKKTYLKKMNKNQPDSILFCLEMENKWGNGVWHWHIHIKKTFQGKKVGRRRASEKCFNRCILKNRLKTWIFKKDLRKPFQEDNQSSMWHD